MCKNKARYLIFNRYGGGTTYKACEVCAGHIKVTLAQNPHMRAKIAVKELEVSLVFP